MTVVSDPEGVSAREILDFVDLRNKSILEIGCGKGRLTFQLADFAKHITAIDPNAGDVQHAIKVTPGYLQEKIEFISQGIEEFELPFGSPLFDLSVFTWSL